jgi:hypothetical protein
MEGLVGVVIGDTRIAMREDEDRRATELRLVRQAQAGDLVAFEHGFLVLAGPVNDPPNGEVNDSDYAVFWWDRTAPPRPLGDLKGYGRMVKPEALVPLDQRGNTLGVLLLFDGPDEGGPQPVEIARP